MSETLNYSLETGRIEMIAETYPEEMREAYIWLCGYVSQDCNRNTDVLEIKAKELGFQTTASTFDKILRGRYNTDSHSRPVAPVMSLKSFIHVVSKLREQAKRSAMAGKVPFVKTSTAQEIYDYIDIRRAPDRVNKFGFIVGPTGSQKTATYRHYCMENNHGACVWMESPAKPSITDFIIKLSDAYGSGRNTSGQRRKAIIRDAVTATRTIIVDNIQRLYRPKEGGNQEIFNYLQGMQDETGCTVILSATPDFKHTFMAGFDKGYFEQFVGRCGGRNEFLELPLWTPIADIEMIAESFGLKDAAKHLNYLDATAREDGRVRILFGDLQKAKKRAELRKESLTINHIRAVRGEDEAA